MIEINPVTGKIVEMALNAAQMRLDVVANNIANANTSNYKPLKVDFESQLELHKKNLVNKSNDDLNKQLLKEVSPQVVQANTESSKYNKDVLIDMELTELSKTVLHYQALLEAKSKIGSVVKMAITGDIR